MPHLWYVPLEGYRERYTMQWSAPNVGWLERNWKKINLPYTRITGGVADSIGPQTISTGSVVDAVGRSRYCFKQIESLLLLAEGGYIKDNDVIYFDDFWTPGLEALPYAFELLKVKPRMYAFLHAQSVDVFDFTAPMKNWMRPFEVGIGRVLDGIITSCPTLQQLIVDGGIVPYQKVLACGHPFSSEEVLERMPQWYRDKEPRKRLNQVVWSSRWDKEKDPLFFLRVAKEVITQLGNETTFVICTSAPKLRSNDPALLEELASAMKLFPGRIVVRENLTKEEYYSILCESKVQFNCALQDFVAITLLEASVAGCYPVYPYFRSFPESFLYNNDFMYGQNDWAEASDVITELLEPESEVLWSQSSIEKRSWIHSRFDTSWIRMLRFMKLLPVDNKVFMSSAEMVHSAKDPFDPKQW